MAIPSTPKQVNSDIECLQRAGQSLQEALLLLGGFNHRNKNQHRVARWWAELGVFRRNVGKLSEEVQTKIAKLEKEKRIKHKKDRGKQTKDNSGLQQRLAPSRDPVDRRAKWMRDQAMPRFYL